MKKTIGILGLCWSFFLFSTFSSLAQTSDLPFEEMEISMEEYQAMKTHKDTRTITSHTGLLRAVGVNTKKTDTLKITSAPLKDNPCSWQGVPFKSIPFVPVSEDAIREEGYYENN